MLYVSIEVLPPVLLLATLAAGNPLHSTQPLTKVMHRAWHEALLYLECIIPRSQFGLGCASSQFWSIRLSADGTMAHCRGRTLRLCFRRLLRGVSLCEHPSAARGTMWSPSSEGGEVGGEGGLMSLFLQIHEVLWGHFLHEVVLKTGDTRNTHTHLPTTPVTLLTQSSVCRVDDSHITHIKINNTVRCHPKML